jgi:hypothetical protein
MRGGCHGYGLAADFVIEKNGAADWKAQDYSILKELGEPLGLTWGGTWGDEDHL